MIYVASIFMDSIFETKKNEINQILRKMETKSMILILSLITILSYIIYRTSRLGIMNRSHFLSSSLDLRPSFKEKSGIQDLDPNTIRHEKRLDMDSTDFFESPAEHSSHEMKSVSTELVSLTLSDVPTEFSSN